ncbi:MAG: hypothetical protein IJM19_07460, partial [Ruminococcus sp.]|nr:hypothetical protein [Ruminococcus sp.]
LNSDGLPLVTHNRPILINFGDEIHQNKLMFYYLHDAHTGSTYEGCKFYSTIDSSVIIKPDTGEAIEFYNLFLIAINPQNGKIHFVLSNSLSNN